MVNTQKLTALAFAFYDGYRSKRQKPEQNKGKAALSDDQEKQKITDLPTPIEFLSYIFYFHGICVGPLCFYKDYRDFIDGQNLLVIPVSRPATTTETFDDKRGPSPKQPSPFWPMLTKLGQCAIWGYVMLAYAPFYPVEYNLSAQMISSPIYKRFAFLFFSTFCVRAK